MQTQQHVNQLPAQVQAAKADLEEMKKALGLGDTADATAKKADTDTGDEPTRKDEPKPQSENWEAKFHTLKGKYDAEVPRLSELARQQNAEIQRLTALVEAGQQQGGQQQDQQQPSTVNREALMAYDDEFGKLVDLIEAQKAQIEAMQAQLGQVQGSVQQVGKAQQETATDIFWRDLRAAVSDFDAINADPAFHAWLAQEDGLSGLTRKQIGDRALSAFDHEKVAKIINEFKSQRGKQPSPPKQDVTPDTKPGNVETRVAQIQAPGEVYRQGELNDFYRKLQGGFPFQWRGQIVKDAAAASLIRIEIQQAGLEGRITP